MVCGQNFADERANIAALSNISAAKAQTHHKFIHNTSNVFQLEISCQWWARRERVPWERRDYDVIGKFVGCVALPEEAHDTEEFEMASWPTMHEEKRDGILLFGEQGGKMKAKLLSVVVLDIHSEVGERVDIFLSCTPAHI